MPATNALDDAASSRERPAVGIDASSTQRQALESPTRRRTALYWRTLRAVYTANPSENGSSSSRATAARDRPGGALTDTKRLTLALGVDCCAVSHQVSNRGLVNVIEELTRALARRQDEAQGSDDTRVLMDTTAALVACAGTSSAPSLK